MLPGIFSPSAAVLGFLPGRSPLQGHSLLGNTLLAGQIDVPHSPGFRIDYEGGFECTLAGFKRNAFEKRFLSPRFHSDCLLGASKRYSRRSRLFHGSCERYRHVVRPLRHGIDFPMTQHPLVSAHPSGVTMRQSCLVSVT